MRAKAWARATRSARLILCTLLLALAAPGCLLVDPPAALKQQTGGAGGTDASAGTPGSAGSSGAVPGAGGRAVGQAGSGADAGDGGMAGAVEPGDPCLGVACDAPGVNDCASTSELKSFDTVGSCTDGVCSYVSHSIACTCQNHQCATDPCLTVTCSSAPKAVCKTQFTLVTYAPSGTCRAGSCSYAAQEANCAFGCFDGACKADACAGVLCTTPPATACKAGTLTKYEAVGACSDGQCSYVATDTPCPFGCDGSACKADPCIGVACNTPPASDCASGQFKTYDTVGSCSMGSCSYTSHTTACTCQGRTCPTDPCLTVTCAAPPASTCKDASTLRKFLSPGACNLGSCSYTPMDTNCAFGCQMGACNLDPCAGVQCTTPGAGTCNGNVLTTMSLPGTCSGGTCSYKPGMMNCAFGCRAGQCNPDPCLGVTCSAPDQCHSNPGTCAAGTCTYPKKADNTGCSNIDSNACTPDTCQAGVCTPGASLTCAAPAVCHTQGVCNTSTGQCSNPLAADHLSCGASRECLGGTCVCSTTSCPTGCCSAAGVCGSCTAQTLFTSINTLNALTLAPPFLYFLETSGGDPMIYSVPIAGGAISSPLVYPQPSTSLTTIWADTSFVYGAPNDFSIPSTVGRMSLVGGPMPDFSDGSYSGPRMHGNTNSVVVGSQLSSNYLNIFPKAGGPSTSLVASPRINPARFAVDDAFVYFISADGAALSRIPFTGGGITNIAAAATGETIRDVALSGNQVVFASSARVAKVLATGGTPVTLDNAPAYAVIADGNAVFFFRGRGADPTKCNSGSDVYGVPVNGQGPLRRLATDLLTTCADYLNLDGNSVYWLSGNVIKKVAR